MLPEHQIILRLLVSAVLGSVVGLERERLNWVAGLRTHMLVCLGSTLFMIVSAYGFTDILGHEHGSLTPRVLPPRSSAGSDFWEPVHYPAARGGAGSDDGGEPVVRRGRGPCGGGGLYLAAIWGTALILVILAGVKPLERRFSRARQAGLLIVVIDRRELSVLAIEVALEAAHLRLKHIRIQRGTAPDEDRLQIRLRRAPRPSVLSMAEQLRSLPGVREVRSHRVRYRICLICYLRPHTADEKDRHREPASFRTEVKDVLTRFGWWRRMSMMKPREARRQDAYRYGIALFGGVIVLLLVLAAIEGLPERWIVVGPIVGSAIGSAITLSCVFLNSRLNSATATEEDQQKRAMLATTFLKEIQSLESGLKKLLRTYEPGADVIALFRTPVYDGAGTNLSPFSSETAGRLMDFYQQIDDLRARIRLLQHPTATRPEPLPQCMPTSRKLQILEDVLPGVVTRLRHEGGKDSPPLEQYLATPSVAEPLYESIQALRDDLCRHREGPTP